MKKTNLKNSDLDNLFKEGLNDFQVPPPSSHNQEDGSKLDDAMRSKLDAFEIKPDEQNWQEIKRRIPLSLKMQRHLNLWSKIAAVLIVGLATSLLVTKYFDYQDEVANSKIKMQPTVPVVPAETDYVYEPQKNADKNEADDDGTARELFNDNIEEVTAVPEHMEVLEKIEPKAPDAIVASDNPLDDKVDRAGKIGDIPLQMQKRVDAEMLSLTPEEEKAASKKKNK